MNRKTYSGITEAMMVAAMLRDIGYTDARAECIGKAGTKFLWGVCVCRTATCDTWMCEDGRIR